MDLQSAKMIGAGLACIALVGAGIGIGNVFGSLISSLARNPAAQVTPFAFLGFALAEIASFVLVAEQIGFLPAFGLVLVVSVLGPFIVRRVGLGVLADTRARLARGEVPTTELLDGLVVLIGGVMICVPGFVGDAIGLALMIGPVRHLLIRTSGSRLARRVQRVPTGRWRVIDVRGRPPSDHDPSTPPPPSIGPGASR